MPETAVKKGKGNGYAAGPVVLGFFVFVVIGSCTYPFVSYILILVLLR